MNGHVLLVGGTKGIGRAVADTMAQAGYDLTLTFASDHAAAEETRKRITTLTSRDVHLLQADARHANSVDTISHHLAEYGICLRAVVVNAGITSRQGFGSLQRRDWDAVLSANVTFPVFLLQSIFERIDPGGAVVLTGSAMATSPHATSLAYGVSKAAVHALAKNLVKFLAPRQIRVNVVAPGFVDTDWHTDKSQDHRLSIESKISLKRFAAPTEVAHLYRVAIENTYLNGSVITVDGGYDFE